MSKHKRKRRTENNRNNNGSNNQDNQNNFNGNGQQQFNNNPFGINPNQLLSMLGNIDMGQIGSLLQNMNVPGLDFNNLDLGIFPNMMGNQSTTAQNARNGNQGNVPNSNLGNNTKNASDNVNYYEENNEDENIKMLKAIRTFVDGGRGEFIDKVINLYNNGAFNDK